jgi:transposase-like protein
VRTDVPTLFVLDGAKALRAAVGRVWGKFAVVQRCQIHKLRNVEALRTTVAWLKRLHPDAAASLEEGLEETLTVVRLGAPEQLRRTLATTNPIERAFSVAESVTRRVKRWRDGDMRQRWCVAGLLDAESRFHRVKGHRHMKALLDALDRQVRPKRLDAHRSTA